METAGEDLLEVARRLEAQGAWGRAEALYRQGLAVLPRHPELRRRLAFALVEMGRGEEAEAIVEALTQDFPEDARGWSQLAFVLGAAELPRALAAAERAVALDGAPAHRYLLGSLQARSELPVAFETLDDAFLDTLPATLRRASRQARLDLALALKDHPRAWRETTAFCAERVADPRFEMFRRTTGQGYVESLLGVEAWAAQVETLDLAESPRLEPKNDPVFVCGFLRSGTTLVGRILDAHPAFEVLDEPDALDRHAIPVLTEATGVAFPDPTRASREALGLARAAYEARMCALVGASDRTLVDKQPALTIRLPFIARAFPRARIVVCVRDPRDACLSTMMKYFEPNPTTAALLSPEESARYHRASFAILHAVQDQLSPPVHVLRYEDLVQDPSSVLADLLEFLAVPWDDAVLRHHQAPGVDRVHTPSRSQVAQPIYRTATERWRHYPEATARMQPFLQENIERYGYALD